MFIWLMGLQWYHIINEKLSLDAMFPKEFCVSNAVELVRVRGCAPFLTEVCMADINLATSKDCTGQNDRFITGDF